MTEKNGNHNNCMGPDSMYDKIKIKDTMRGMNKLEAIAFVSKVLILTAVLLPLEIAGCIYDKSEESFSKISNYFRK